LALLAATAAAAGGGSSDGSSVATALALCRDADFLPPDDKDAQRVFLESGMAIADDCAARHPDDPKAQLALSCILGKQLVVSGISWRSLQRLRRLQAVIDTALRLAPDDPDALVAKGEMLHQIPGALGGDDAEAERLFRRAVAQTGEHVRARIYLAQVLAERREAGAREEATVALTLAQRDGTPRELADARALFGATAH
jgi:hypothetical protein